MGIRTQAYFPRVRDGNGRSGSPLPAPDHVADVKKPKLVAYRDYESSGGPRLEGGSPKVEKRPSFLVFQAIKSLTLELARVFMGVEPNDAADKMNQAW